VHATGVLNLGLRGGSSSTIGTWLDRYVLGHQYSYAAMEPPFPTGYFLRTESGFRFLGCPNKGTMPEEALARSTWLVRFHFIRTQWGLWAPTTERVRGYMATGLANCPPETAEQIRLAARGHMAEMECHPRYAPDCERIAQARDFDETRSLPGGVAHNTVSVVVAGLTLFSLAWLRGPLARWLVYRPRTRGEHRPHLTSPCTAPAPRA
jgi:hypothetical protein